MSPNGTTPPGDGGDGSDWIDRVLARAGDESAASAGGDNVVETTMPLPVVPETEPPVVDGLPEIRWVDSETTPASATVVAPPAGQAGLTAQDVGRSAWSDQLAVAGAEDPQGWDKLSWEDLEDRKPHRGDPIQGKTSSFARLLREWGPVLIAAVTIAIVTRLFLVQAYHIPSLSMAPTLDEGDRVIVNRLSYRFGDIERGQVVVFSKPPTAQPGANDLIKRVIGLPGETVRINGGNVFIDDLLVQEPYLAAPESTQPPPTAIPGCDQAESSKSVCKVPDGFVFVMGDNRRGSSDSRVFGPVPTDTVVGRAFVRIWPLNNISWL